MLSNSDIAELTAFRRNLHRFPEVSGAEEETARRICGAFEQLKPDQIIPQLGGHGVAAVFQGAAPGPTVLFRCELDALPIEELSDIAHRSTIPGTGHLCGHDGHMTIILALGRLLSRNRPARGRVVLMFQPAEEDGSGAAAVIADPAFAPLHPDWAFALHNMPGARLGEVWLSDGPVNCASVGMKITLAGKTSHASQPEHGRSPGLALARLIPALGELGPGGALGPAFRMVTVTHARLGEPAFGIAPGHAEIWATLRTMLDAPMADLRAAAVDLVQAVAREFDPAISWHDDFAACTNHPEATAHIAAALDHLHIPHDEGDLPMRGSEDFGRFGNLPGCKSAMLFLGAGQEHAALHNPDYDFPDDLIPIGARIFHRIVETLLG